MSRLPPPAAAAACCRSQGAAAHALLAFALTARALACGTSAPHAHHRLLLCAAQVAGWLGVADVGEVMEKEASPLLAF